MAELTDEETKLLDLFVQGPFDLAPWQYTVLVDAGLLERGPRVHRLTRRGIKAANNRTGGSGLIVSGPAGIGRAMGQALQRDRRRR